MPENEAGIVLIVLGVVLMAVGIFFWPICGLGIVLLIVGVILLAVHPSQPMYYAPAPAPYAYAPQPPAAPVQPTPGAYTPPACPVCGSPLTWVAQYGRWYCTRCQAYR
ncbi:MAG: hypothetical protein AABX97_01780 [Candidatus Thermoplasmatota archaeon]